jgi:hypothetical protein
VTELENKGGGFDSRHPFKNARTFSGQAFFI